MPTDIHTSDIKSQTPLHKAAAVISNVFTPIAVPTYAMALALWLTPLVVLPERMRLAVTGVIALITAVLPMASIFALMRLGRISDFSISDRRERIIPFTVSVACYIGAAIYLRAVHAPSWLMMFYIGAAVTSAIAMIISLWWKISAHSSASGGLVGIVGWLAFKGLINAGGVWWLTGMIILVGLVATSRLILHRHTLAQVIAGAALGCAVEILIMNI